MATADKSAAMLFDLNKPKNMKGKKSKSKYWKLLFLKKRHKK